MLILHEISTKRIQHKGQYSTGKLVGLQGFGRNRYAITFSESKSKQSFQQIALPIWSHWQFWFECSSYRRSRVRNEESFGGDNSENQRSWSIPRLDWAFIYFILLPHIAEKQWNTQCRWKKQKYLLPPLNTSETGLPVYKEKWLLYPLSSSINNALCLADKFHRVLTLVWLSNHIQ